MLADRGFSFGLVFHKMKMTIHAYNKVVAFLLDTKQSLKKANKFVITSVSKCFLYAGCPIISRCKLLKRIAYQSNETWTQITF